VGCIRRPSSSSQNFGTRKRKASQAPPTANILRRENKMTATIITPTLDQASESFKIPNDADKLTPTKDTKASAPTAKVESATSASAFSMALSLGAYLYFFAVFLWMMTFLMPSTWLPTVAMAIIPHTMDTAPKGESAIWAIAVNVTTMFSFVVLHSILARPRVKQLMRLPKTIERPIFVLQADILLHSVLQLWTNFDGPTVWDVSHSERATNAFMAVYIGLGVLNLFTATLAIDHFDLFGLSQGFGTDFNALIGLADKPTSDAASVAHSDGHQKMVGDHIQTRWHYNYVAHPIMTGFFFMCWATPTMSAPRLLFASILTLYIVIAVAHFEEPDLEKECGHSYTKYLQTVPRFFPWMAPAKKFKATVKKIN